MELIYVLKCEKNKWYVGKTTKSIRERYDEHINGNGSEFTKINKPIEIYDGFISNCVFDEDNTTKKYMNMYGIENVRGGTYIQIELPKYHIKTLNDELCTSGDKCFGCGLTDHYINECPGKKRRQSMTHEELGVQPTNKKIKSSSNSSGQCFKCKRSGHWANNCFAKTTLDGEYIYRRTKW